jgi:class 3 adenylate cyclase
VNCTGCGFDNPAAMKFCGSCGEALASGCSACGFENPPGFKFCGQCGGDLTASGAPTPSAPTPDRAPVDYTPKHLADKILTSRSALEGERKQVTVLFADVKGSMELAERLDPEQWHSILDRFFQILAEGVHRFEGTVNQYTGDGIMALFGAPIAHEDHAQRACYAALALREELRTYATDLRIGRGLDFSVRMGLNSGEVIVGKIGDDLRMDYTAQGHTVGLAQRMEQIAESGAVYLSRDTAQRVEGYFELRDLGESPIRGVDAPVGVFELQGVGPHRTRLDVSRSRGLSKFVGRDDEMAALDAALEHMREGHGQVVGVVAEAGAGKSRLCFEFLEHCRSQGLAIFEARGVAHGAALPFHPIRELFRSYYGITEQDPPALARQKIAGQLLLLDDSFREILPVIFEFLGVPDPDHRGPTLDPDARNRELRRLMHDVTRAGDGGQITLLEDLHWFDEASLDYLAQLVELSVATGALILVNFRPEFHAGWMQKSYYQQLPLVPLGPEAIRALLEDVLGPDPSVLEMPEIITKRTAGNPFFVEETVQSLIESSHLEGTRGAYRLATPVEHLPLPATVQAVLAARIDRLGEREKQTLQTAAVIGKEFTEPLLAQVLALSDADRAAALDALKLGEFVYETALYPVSEYAFKHPLTQEVAYDSQLVETRRPIHAAAAKAIERVYPDDLDEQAALLAHHSESAGEHLKAAQWHARAGSWSGVASEAAALLHWQQVRALLADGDETPTEIELATEACVRMLNFSYRVGLSGISDAETTTLFEEGKRLAERSGDPIALADLHTIYGALREVRFNDSHGHLDLARESVRISEKAGDPQSQLDALVGLTSALAQGGNLREAVECADRGLELAPDDRQRARRIWGWDSVLHLRATRAASSTLLGLLAEGRAGLEHAARDAKARDEFEVGQQIASWRCQYAELAGDEDLALEQAHYLVALADRFEGTVLSTEGFAYLCRAHLLAGQIENAARAWERWRRAVADLGMEGSEYVVQQQPFMAALARRLGEPERALELLRDSAAKFREGGLDRFALAAELELGRVWLEIEGPDSDAFAQARASAGALVERMGARAFEPCLNELDAERARRLGDPATQAQHLREAQRKFSEMGASGHAKRVAQELAALGA